MAKKIILLGLLLITLVLSGCVWYGGHGHGYGYTHHGYPGYYHHHGWDRHDHGRGSRHWR